MADYTERFTETAALLYNLAPISVSNGAEAFTSYVSLANYHRAVNASQTFAAIDSWLWQKTWRWARRRHPNKSARWTKAKYFGTSGHRHWVFVARTIDSEGRRKTVSLVKASDTKIRYHVKIKGEANPFDPQWETYFEDRLGLTLQGSLRGQRKLLHLWWRQNKRCVLCETDHEGHGVALTPSRSP